MREAGHVERVGEVMFVYSSLVRKPEGKRCLKSGRIMRKQILN
jgi:hypothetical protein